MEIENKASYVSRLLFNLHFAYYFYFYHYFMELKLEILDGNFIFYMAEAPFGQRYHIMVLCVILSP